MSRFSLIRHLLASTGGGGGGTSAFTYDTSIGNGVDTNGFASLPLRGGARYIYVGNGGNDANDGLTHATRRATIASGASLITDSNGDQLLIAQGSTFSEALPNMNGKRGFSPLYPTVIQSYDPADPTNTTKFGRATGTNRPVINTGAHPHTIGGGGGGSAGQPASRIAWRGLDINPGDVDGAAGAVSVSVVPSSSGTNDHLLFENCIFRYTMLDVEQGSYPAHNSTCTIVRNCSLYGQWATTGHAQGAFLAAIDGITLEDNVWWHNGWRIGVSRDNTIATGGLTGDEVFRHVFYIGTECKRIVVRRNLIIDGPADGGQHRGNSLVSSNFYIDNPMTVALGGGTHYEANAPTGRDLEFALNGAVGDADITSSYPRGEFIASSNGRSGSVARYNVFARSRVPANVPYAFETDAQFNVPSYMLYDHNIGYLWSTPTHTVVDNLGSYPSQIHATYSNNLWDDNTSGTNTNVSGHSFPNAYTAASLYSAAGYADKQSLINDAIANPEKRLARTLLSLWQTGYGLSVPGTPTLSANITVTAGQTDSSIIYGTLDGWTLSATGLPTGLTIDSPTRTWSYDGTGVAGSGTFTLSATPPGGGSPTSATISYTILTAPVLSGVSVSGVGTTTATVNFTTDTGNGTAYIVVSPNTSLGTPTQGQMLWGYDQEYGPDGGYPLPTDATQAITSTGAKTVNITGLTTAKPYHAFVMHRGSNGAFSLVSGPISFTTS